MRCALRRLATVLVLLLPWGGLPTPAAGEGEEAARTRLLDPAAVARRLRAGIEGGRGGAAARLALARLERDRCDLQAARRLARALLDQDPLDGDAHALLAELRLLEGRHDDALARVEVALALPGGDLRAEPWRIKALAHLARGEVARAGRAARRAASLAPGDARALEALARTRYRAGDMPGATRAYQRAARLDPLTEEAHLRLGSGFGPAPGEARWRAGPLGRTWARGRAALAAGDLEDALEAFAVLVRERPEEARGHLGLGLTLAALRRAADPTAAPRVARHARRPAPEVAGLRDVVLGYDDLLPSEQHAVRMATAPAAPWWPALVASGATHEILPLERQLTDARRRAELADRRTGDGRRYVHLRGVGGLHAATGVEKLREAADLAFHVFAHELAHQLHRHALAPEQVAEVDALYADALEHDRCLDWYAASNVDEYFAQGYEAMISPTKRGCLKETQGHTREELARRDPPLHAFFLRHLALDHEADAGPR